MKRLATTGKYLLAGIGILTAIYLISIYLWAAAYTILAADDFSHGVSLGLYKAFFPLHLLGSLAFMLKLYISWQGTYVSMFLQALLSPINGYVYPQLRIVMVVNALLILASIFIVVYELFQLLPVKYRFLIPVVYSLVLLGTYGFGVYHEVFFWYSGATSYGFPFTAMMVALFFALKYNRTHNEKFVKIAKIMGFLAAGGTLMIAGTLCYLGLILFGTYYFWDKALDKNNKKIFQWWLGGALLNTVAPGNYIRKYAEGHSNQGVIKSAIESVKIVLRNIWRMSKQGGLLWILVIFVIIGCIVGIKTLDKHNRLIILSAAVLAQGAAFVAAFPATLGYSASYALNNRCNFVINSTFVITICFMAMIIGYCIPSLLQNKTIIAYPCLLVILAFIYYICPMGLADNSYFELNAQLAEHEIQDYYNECKEFLASVDAKEDNSEVVISREDLPQQIKNTNQFYYFDDETNPDSWLNKALSTYYNLKSFSVE